MPHFYSHSDIEAPKNNNNNNNSLTRATRDSLSKSVEDGHEQVERKEAQGAMSCQDQNQDQRVDRPTLSLRSKIAAIVFITVQLVVLVLGTIGVPLAQFTPTMTAKTRTEIGIPRIVRIQDNSHEPVVHRVSHYHESSPRVRAAAVGMITAIIGWEGNESVALSEVFYAPAAATPSDRWSSPSLPPSSCFTLWGFKQACGKTQYDLRTEAWGGCTDRKATMITASVLSVVTVLSAIRPLIIGGVMLYMPGSAMFMSRLRLMLIISVCTNTLLSIACWACVVAVYNVEMCSGTQGQMPFKGSNAAVTATPTQQEQEVSSFFFPGNAFKSFTRFGSGFYLLIVSSALQWVALVPLLWM